MNKKLLTALCALVTLAVAWGALAGIFWEQRTIWPQFPNQTSSSSAAAANAPQIVVRTERDYGWRTGDRIPVDLYIRQMPGTVIDINSLAVQGDFEIRQQPSEPIVRQLKDGSTLYRFQFEVQSMAVKPKLTLDANMSFRLLSTGEDNTVALPGLTLYTSMTYDGRPDIQQGPQKFIFGFDLLIVSLMVSGGVVLIVLCLSWIRRINQERASIWAEAAKYRMTPLERVQHNFNETWRRIEAGDRRDKNYRELEENVRWLFKIKTRTLKEADLQLEMTNDPYHQEVVAIITECDKVLYEREQLSDEQHKLIYEAFQRIFEGTPLPKRKPEAEAANPSNPEQFERMVEAALAEAAEISQEKKQERQENQADGSANGAQPAQSPLPNTAQTVQGAPKQGEDPAPEEKA